MNFEQMARELAGACELAPWGDLTVVRCRRDSGYNNQCDTCQIAFRVEDFARRVADAENEACEKAVRALCDEDETLVRRNAMIRVTADEIAARRKNRSGT